MIPPGTDLDDTALAVTCEVCGPLPNGERLYDFGGEKVHSVIVRPGDSWSSYYGPTPDEAEPCGPVTLTGDAA